jgi:hypothetical protein
MAITTASIINTSTLPELIGNIIIFIISAGVYLFVLYVAFIILCQIVTACAILISRLLTLANIPFYLLNALQRFLAKPWRVLIKYNRFSDSTNETLRTVTRYAKIPFYIALFPLRFFLACYYNILIHCVYECINYLLEVVMPQRNDEGYNNLWKWIYMLPKRVLKYLCLHGSLTIIESLIWTVIDTFLPALTLYHGTKDYYARSILSSPDRSTLYGREVSQWIVGTGNFAGNGIYFAPVYSTGSYYCRGGVVILCRVTLGRTLDLGLAPYRVYHDCGEANATIATRWGLEHNYVTGEWWRSDRGWWEYCMYDWQNRYNYSWRIRPIYVIPRDGNLLQRIPGGMYHWLFRKVVLEDIWRSMKEFPQRLKHFS